MRHGPCLDKGFLPVFSVADAEEAEMLIVLACPTNMKGEYIAPELAEEQTLKNLEAFSTKLDRAHDMLKQAGRCRCSDKGEK